MGSVQIRSYQIGDNQILSAKVADNAILSAKIADNAIVASKISGGSVGTAAIASAAITAPQIASNAVTTAALNTACVTSDKLNGGAVVTAALAALCVTEPKIASGAITASKLGSACVGSAAIADNAITTAKIASNAVNASKLLLTDTYDFSGGTVRVAATPSNNNDATSKQYVDNVAAGAHFKKAVVVASGANIDLSDLPATIDGQTLATDDRFAVINQSTGSQNGIYTYTGDGSAASRTSDMNANEDFPAAAFFVVKGTNGDKAYVCTNDVVNLGVTAISFTQFAGSGSSTITASGGLQKIAEDISIVDNGVTTARINNGAVTQSKVANDAIGTAQVANAAITQAKLSADSVGASQVINGSIGSDEIASNAVVSSKILDANITTAKLADSLLTVSKFGTACVATAAIQDGAINAAKLGADCVTNTAIADGAINASAMLGAGVVDTNSIAGSAITAAKIAAGAVGSSALANLSVSSAKVQDAAITAVKWGLTPKVQSFTGSAVTTIDLSSACPANLVNYVKVYKNGIYLRNMTALGDTAADNDEFNVSATGGGGGNCRLTFGAAVDSADVLLVDYLI